MIIHDRPSSSISWDDQKTLAVYGMIAWASTSDRVLYARSDTYQERIDSPPSYSLSLSLSLKRCGRSKICPKSYFYPFESPKKRNTTRQGLCYYSVVSLIVFLPHRSLLSRSPPALSLADTHTSRLLSPHPAFRTSPDDRSPGSGGAEAFPAQELHSTSLIMQPLQHARDSAEPSPTYTSSFNPSAPHRYGQLGRPTVSPRVRRTTPSDSKEPGRNKKPHRLEVLRLPSIMHYILRPRFLLSVLLWSLSLYFVHRFLLPLPIPSFRISLPKTPSASDHFLATTFPAPALREGDDSLDSVDPRYRPFSPLPPPDAPFPRLRPTRFLPPRCLEQWFIDGETLCGRAELGEEERLDATWLWVNGSDERWRESMIHWREQEGVYSPEHHFRCVREENAVANNYQRAE